MHNFTPVASTALAVAVADNTTKTNPGTSGCGGFAWSRLERSRTSSGIVSWDLINQTLTILS